MKTVKLSKVFAKKYSIYLTIIVSLLICCFMFFAEITTNINIDNKKDGEKVIKYNWNSIVFEFNNLDSLALFIVLLIILIGLSCLFTFIYSKYTARKLNESLSYLKMMTEKIRREEYDFSEYQENISEFAEVKESFFIMAKKINEEIEKTRRSEEIRKKLILDISHDLKNPLMSIDGYIELMLENTKADNQEKYLKIISENSKRANNLVMNLFELAKLESAEYAMEFKIVDFAEIVKNVLIERLNELECNGIATDFFIPDEEILIMGSEKELRRAISNILDNVIKYHKEKSVFKVACKRQKNVVCLMFSNASAVKLENIKKLMEPFVRLQGSDELNAEGAGLGLSIVQKIIEAHNGKINCWSDEEREFKISIELPL
ncbi:HAMP domain-containing sensor histidine kinase [Clostridium sp. OS1-26]|uniref:sensor histidine kinase n=1 Tax=Clostridium sp. OS1-26 TaxID=3070681 RepID=UPI0027E00830|nr:HAMP domain-containing sensor histidine kinase [Clostridium sp. OS1-26]WML32560.1 HAMP domain-containing sensor histidine kinase [Clostridium sp. OS1-26]